MEVRSFGCSTNASLNRFFFTALARNPQVEDRLPQTVLDSGWQKLTSPGDFRITFLLGLVINERFRVSFLVIFLRQGFVKHCGVQIRSDSEAPSAVLVTGLAFHRCTENGQDHKKRRSALKPRRQRRHQCGKLEQ